MNFKDLLLRAKDGDQQAKEEIFLMYRPLLFKESCVNGIFDEDLFQELTWRISNYTPEYRETSGVGKRPVLTPDEVLRLPIKQALVIIRGQKVLKVDKMDYSKHPEASKLRSCKASAHIPEWRRLEQEQPKPSAAQPKPQAPAPKKPVKKKPKAASTSTNTKQTAAVPTAEAPNGIITTDKDSILS